MKKKELRRETSKVLIIGLLLGIFRWLPAKPYNKMLNGLMNTIRKEAFKEHAYNFVDIVKFSSRTSRGYKDAITEYEDMKKYFVCLKPVYPMLWTNVRNHRKKVGLPL